MPHPAATKLRAFSLPSGPFSGGCSTSISNDTRRETIAFMHDTHRHAALLKGIEREAHALDLLVGKTSAYTSPVPRKSAAAAPADR